MHSFARLKGTEWIFVGHRVTAEFEESLNSAYLDYCGFLEQVFKRFKGFDLKLTQSKLLSRAFYLKTQTIINIFCFT